MAGGLFHRQEELPKYCAFDRRLFIVLAVHWAILVAAVPVFALIQNETAFGISFLVGFLSFFILCFTKPARYLTNTRGRELCADVKTFSVVIRILMVPLAVMVIYGIFSLREGGPRINEGVYCLWNHRFIREITQAEYVRLSRIERAFFCSGLALVRSAHMYNCCYADRIV